MSAVRGAYDQVMEYIVVFGSMGATFIVGLLLMTRSLYWPALLKALRTWGPHPLNSFGERRRALRYEKLEAAERAADSALWCADRKFFEEMYGPHSLIHGKVCERRNRT
jgi:hypothetical protein